MARRYTSPLSRGAITPKDVYMNRRAFMGASVAATGIALAGQARAAAPLRAPNTFEQITSYNNYYEFGTGKDDPMKHAHRLTTDPWSITIDGLVERPGAYPLGEIVSKMTIEERIYRFRCVEAWSMVIPWQGFELADLLAMAGVKPEAKYVAFETVLRPEEMPGTRWPVLDWPYREGLRMDEAMHPLTIMGTGIYDEPMPNQNGGPIRLVVPWKYGFKSIKSVVRITLTDSQPYATWNATNAREYGFYSNVNPEVDHPRWSQASERVIGSGLFAKRAPTLMFNGYEAEVASLYAGMDLAKNF